MRARERPNRPIHYILGGIVDGAMLWVMHQVPRWQVPFITAQYPRILPAVTVSLAVQMAFYALLIVVHPLWLHYLAQMVYAAVSAVALLVILRVFPFDFAAWAGDWLNTAVRILLIVAFVGTLISGVVSLVHFLRSLGDSGRASQPRS
jgi:hypothetical protein